MLVEILAKHAPTLIHRCQMIRCGPASVGQALGQMVERDRFPRKTCVILDGDNEPMPGCSVLPGEDAPERVVFEALKSVSWSGLENRTGRAYSDVVDACEQAMVAGDHHEWVRTAAIALTLGGDTLWQAMCAEWAANCLSSTDAERITRAIEMNYKA